MFFPSFTSRYMNPYIFMIGRIIFVFYMLIQNLTNYYYGYFLIFALTSVMEVYFEIKH